MGAGRGLIELPGPPLDPSLGGGDVCKWCKRLGRWLLWNKRACIQAAEINLFRIKDMNIVDGLKVGGMIW